MKVKVISPSCSRFFIDFCFEDGSHASYEFNSLPNDVITFEVFHLNSSDSSH